MSGSGLVAAGPTPAGRTREFGPDSASAPVRAAMLKPGKRGALFGLCCGERELQLRWKEGPLSPSPTENVRGRGGPAVKAKALRVLGCGLFHPHFRFSVHGATAHAREGSVGLA